MVLFFVCFVCFSFIFLKILFADRITTSTALVIENKTLVKLDDEGKRIDVKNEILNQKTAITNKYYTLVGWSTNPDTNSDDASFEITTNTNNLTLYAVWARNKVQVVYTSSMDSDLPERHTIDQGGEFNFTEDGFTKNGYYVEGFKVNGETYNVGDKIECVEDENLVVDVVWK